MVEFCLFIESQNFIAIFLIQHFSRLWSTGYFCESRAPRGSHKNNWILFQRKAL